MGTLLEQQICFSASNEGNSVDHYTLYFMRMCYSNRKFGSDWSIMMGTLLGQRISYWPVFQLLLEEILWNCRVITLHAHAINTVRLVVIGQ